MLPHLVPHLLLQANSVFLLDSAVLSAALKCLMSTAERPHHPLYAKTFAVAAQRGQLVDNENTYIFL